MNAEGAIEGKAFVPRAGSSSDRVTTAILIAGLAAIVLPTLWTLARWSWSTDAGAHGPIVLATGLWLMWRERRFANGVTPAYILPAAAILALACPIYYFGRVTQVLLAEGVAMFTICLAVAALRFGWKTVSRFWFPILYLMFILSPPENWLFVATRPIKSMLAAGAVDFMTFLGFDVAGTASLILIDGYKLQVAAACSGVNSLIGITAIGLFYIYLRHGSQLRYATIMVAMLLPVAIITNFLRIILLIIVTKFSGDGTAFDFAHDFGGVAIFGLALIILLMLDEIMYPIVKRLGWIR